MSERRVDDVMTMDVVTVREDTPIKQVASLMTEHGIVCLPVVDEDRKVVGLVSEAALLPDLMETSRPRRWLRPRSAKVTAARAREMMSAPTATVPAGTEIAKAARLMTEPGTRRLPVVDANGVLVGIVAPRDLLKVFLRPDADVRREIIEQVFTNGLGVPPALIDVEVRGGVAILSGEVPAASDVPFAVRMASAVDGVVAVENRLTAAVDDHRRPRTADLTDY
ncbi:MAG TPA: CBS domain-containing protein [Spirillospora sp.]|nr:CBS domain-containing protein [Spirillospora sp.]